MEIREAKKHHEMCCENIRFKYIMVTFCMKSCSCFVFSFCLFAVHVCVFWCRLNTNVFCVLQGPSRLELSKPLIAAVSGFAVAGGLELALLADLRVMEESAVMGVFCRRFGTSDTWCHFTAAQCFTWDLSRWSGDWTSSLHFFCYHCTALAALLLLCSMLRFSESLWFVSCCHLLETCTPPHPQTHTDTDLSCLSSAVKHCCCDILNLLTQDLT